MLKIYKMPNGRKYQFEETAVPSGAVPVEVKAEEPKDKAVKPQNKRKAVKTK